MADNIIMTSCEPIINSTYYKMISLNQHVQCIDKINAGEVKILSSVLLS